MERNFGIPQDELTGGKKRIVIADISSMVENRAKDIAAEKSHESTEKPKGILNKIKDFGKKIWKRSELHNTIERYKAEKAIRESGNLFTSEKESATTPEEKAKKEKDAKDAHDATVKAVTDRFSASKEFDKDFIHTGAGEHKKELEDSAFKKEIIGLVKAYARGESHNGISEAEFFKEKQLLLDKVKQEHPAEVDKGKMYADNLFEVAKWAKDKVHKQVEQGLDHTIAMMQLDEHFEVVVGKAKDAVRTEAHYNAIDKITDKIQKYTGGSLNEAAVAAGVAAIYGATGKIVEGSLKKAATIFGAGMAASGAAGALRESRKLEQERAIHAREMAQGKQVKGDKNKAKRREEMEKSRIQFKEASKIEGDLSAQLFNKLETKDVTELTETEFQLAMQTLADLESRVDLSDWGLGEKGWLNKKNKYSVDLIGYSDVKNTAAEQGKLDIARARAKILLKKYAEAKGKNFENDLKHLVKVTTENLLNSKDKGINQQAEVFAKMKKKEVKKAFVKSALISGGIGIVIQEVRAAFDDEIEGAAEHLVQELKGNHHIPKTGERTTLVEGAYRRGKELYEQTFGSPTPKGPSHDVMMGANKFKLENGVNFQSDPTTTDPNDYYLVDKAGNKISDRLQLNPDGSLSADAKKWLTDHGFKYKETLGSKGVGGIHNLNKAETLKKFPGLSPHDREDWHDEPGQFWSDVHHKMLEFEGTQQMGFLEKHGDKVYLNASKVADNFLKNIQDQIDAAGNTMPGFGEVDGYKDGAGNTFVAEKLKHLKEQIQKSVDDGSFFEHFQAAVIPTEGANTAGLSDLIEGADADGKIFLGADWSKYFTNNSQLMDGHLPFKFLELRFDGHVIGTARGFGEDIISTPITEITSPDGTVPFEVVPPIPVYRGRRPGLEEMENPIIYCPPPDSLYRGRLSEGEIVRLKREMSERLRNNPDANLDHFEELEDYFSRMDKRRLLKTKVLARQAGDMNHNTTIAINIPVAGHQEGANIYQSLKNYTNQTLDSDKFEINLFVNHPDVDMNGKRVHPDQTLSEIKRFQKDFPDINVKVMYEVLPRDEAKIGNIRKYLNDAVLWRHHERGREVPDLIMVSNDADNKGMSPDYLQNFENKFSKNPKVDSFLGQIDWDPEAYINNPLLHVGTRFFQYSDIQTRRRDSSSTQSSGANFAFRSSIYAAVNGYGEADTIAEDVVLGNKIKAARSGSNDSERSAIRFAGARSSRVYTSARRAMNALEKGLSPIEQWHNGFSAFDDEVRRYEMSEGGIDFSKPEEIDKFLQNLESVLNRTLKVLNGGISYWQSTPIGGEIDKSLRLLGIEYSNEPDGSIKIVNAKKLIEGLESYQAEGMELLRKKTTRKDKVEDKEKESANRVASKLDAIIVKTKNSEATDQGAINELSEMFEAMESDAADMGPDEYVGFVDRYVADRLPQDEIVQKLVPAIELYDERRKEKKRQYEADKTELRSRMEIIYNTALNESLTDATAVRSIRNTFKDSEGLRRKMKREDLVEAMSILNTLPTTVWNKRINPIIGELSGASTEARKSNLSLVKERLQSRWGQDSIHFQEDTFGLPSRESGQVLDRLSRTFETAKQDSLDTEVFNKVFSGKSQRGLHVILTPAGSKIGFKAGYLNLPIDSSQEKITKFMEAFGGVEFKPKRKSRAPRRRS